MNDRTFQAQNIELLFTAQYLVVEGLQFICRSDRQGLVPQQIQA